MPNLTTNNRGQTAMNRAVSIVVALAVVGLVAGVLAPVALNELTDDRSTSFQSVNETETVQVSAQLNATLDSVDNTGGTIDVTVADEDTGSSVTFTGVSGNETQTLEGEDITLVNDGTIDSSTANFSVEYPPDYGTSAGASALWGILDLAIVLVIFLFMVGFALMKSRL